tara:strand:+ start:1165 stop:2355 length:1191 start_codon:yes stop_codon:yes gene_type:complete
MSIELMKVLHVIPSLSPAHGGPSKALPLMAEALSAEGVEVTIVTTDDDGPGRRLPQPVEFPENTDFGPIWRFPKQTEFYKVSFPLSKWIRRHINEFDVVHVHALFSYTSVAAARIARKAGVPYIIRPLGVLNSYGISNRRKLLKKLSIRRIEAPLLRDAAAMHFTSNAEKIEAEELSIPMRPRIIPLGIPIAASTEDSHDPPCRETPYVLFLSRVDPKKNLESLFKAWADLDDVDQNKWDLRIAGDGPPDYVTSLKSLAENLGISDSVFWEGYVSGSDKDRLLREASVFALPSYSENFGIAAVEAMGFGLPSLIGKGVAVGEEAVDDHACLLTDPSPESVRDQLQRLLDDKNLRSSLGKAAKAFVEREYSLERMGRALSDLYAELTSPAHESHGSE